SRSASTTRAYLSCGCRLTGPAPKISCLAAALKRGAMRFQDTQAAATSTKDAVNLLKPVCASKTPPNRIATSEAELLLNTIAGPRQATPTSNQPRGTAVTRQAPVRSTPPEAPM